jgi:alkanesulfonate monooxygenase SsuD/methylene tetrahydromethanopterin reductase-like flavin-dependent oxidoreductase (luciferase family)
MVKFGVSVPTGREGLMVPTGFASWETIIYAGKVAEELGFYSVWGNDHITVQDYIRDTKPLPAFFDPLISMAAISSLTKKIKLITGIFVLPWRSQSIVVCANQLASLDVLSGGRLILGIGTGAYREESRALYIDHNLKRMNEGVKALRILFSESKATFEGDFMRFRDVEMFPKPIQKPFPIYVGRHLTTPAVLKWVAKHSQGWIPGLSPKQFAEAIPRLEKTLKEEGRSLEEIDIVREVSLCQAENRDIAVKKLLETPAFKHIKSLLLGRNGRIDLEQFKERSLLGNANDIIKGIQRYLDVGVNHFMFNFAVSKPRDLVTSMESFANDIAPSFA